MWPNFANMLTWWQWLVLAVVPPAIVALYFLKLRRRPIEVPSTYLWHKSIEDLHVNSIWQRLRRNLLLLLQLLLVALAMGALIRPTWHALRLSGGRQIFLIDNSASMQATDVAPSRLDEAKRRVAELIDQTSSSDVAMIVSFSDTARVEQTFTNDRRQLLRSLEAIRPTQRPTSLLEALKVASGLANPGRSAEDISDVRVAEPLPARLFIFSDGKFPPVTGFSLGNLEPVFVPIGDPTARNVGIVAFSTGRKESKRGQLQAFARLQNFGPGEVSASTELLMDGRLIDAARVDLPAGEARGVAFDLGEAQSGTLKLRVAGGDHLAVDDEAWTVVGPPRRTSVLLVTPGNEPLEMALKTGAVQQMADVTFQSPAFLKTKEYRASAAGAAYHLVIFDRCQPEVMPQANALLLGGLPPEGGWSAGARVGNPAIIDVAASHPLVQWVDTGDVVLAEATPLKPPPGARVLMDSDAGPLLAIAPREAFEDVVMGFVLVGETAGKDGKPKRYIGTNWPIRPSFPIFILNLLNYLGGTRDAMAATGVAPGRPVSFDAPANVDTAVVRTPTGETAEVKREKTGRFTFTETGALGIYEAQAGAKTIARFAVNLFDAGESDIRPNPAPAIKIGYVEVAGQSGWETARREIWKGLLLAGLFVLLLEWYIYKRRVHV